MKKIISALCCIAIILCSCVACERSRVRLGNVVIFGDSYSTYGGYIPDEYATWYYDGATFTNVTSVKDTWWHQLLKTTRSKLLLNSSYSGSTVSHTGYDGGDYSTFSFVARAMKLANEGYFEQNEVDTVIIYGGINDTCAGSPLGEVKYDNVTDEDLYSVLPAMSKLLSVLRESTSDLEIIVIIDTQINAEMQAGFNELAIHYSAIPVFTPSVALLNAHPSSAGMYDLYKSILTALEERM